MDGVTSPTDNSPSIETEPDTPAAGDADAQGKLVPTRSSGNSDSVEARRYDPEGVDRRRPPASDGSVRSCAMLPSAEVFRGLRHRPDETPRTVVDIGVSDRDDCLRVHVALLLEAIEREVRVVERHHRSAPGCRDRRVQRLRIVKREESLVGEIAQISSADETPGADTLIAPTAVPTDTPRRTQPRDSYSERSTADGSSRSTRPSKSSSKLSTASISWWTANTIVVTSVKLRPWSVYSSNRSTASSNRDRVV